MRDSRRFVILSTLAAWAAPALAACSASSGPAASDAAVTDAKHPSIDAGLEAEPPPDSAEAAARDTGGDASREAGSDAPTEACAVDADLATISLPDAGLGDDASIATCLACARSSCPSYVAACDTDCTCVTALVGLFECRASGQSLTDCSVSLLGMGNAFALGECTISLCGGACGGSNVFGQDAGD